jgi:sugar fermentation stimulation protein A
MKYDNIKRAVFLDRPNRFIANIELDGRREVCHVKNTGRCKELLLPGAEIYVQELDIASRKTKLDLISVRKGSRLINMDAAAPNRVFMEWLPDSQLFKDITLVKPESSFGSSRFDFYVEAEGKKAYIEVKGVTLEAEGIVRFPDAPTERGVKHLSELVSCVNAGFQAYAVFIVQMKDVSYFEPNDFTHPAFGAALREAFNSGVKVLALDCEVSEDSISISDYVQVRL